MSYGGLGASWRRLEASWKRFGMPKAKGRTAAFCSVAAWKPLGSILSRSAPTVSWKGDLPTALLLPQVSFLTTRPFLGRALF